MRTHTHNVQVSMRTHHHLVVVVVMQVDGEALGTQTFRDNLDILNQFSFNPPDGTPIDASLARRARSHPHGIHP